MKLYILAVGNKMPSWINTAFLEYAKRLRQEFTIHLFERVQREIKLDFQRIYKY